MKEEAFTTNKSWNKGELGANTALLERLRRKWAIAPMVGALAIAGASIERGVAPPASPVPPPDAIVQVEDAKQRLAAPNPLIFLERSTADRPDEVSGPQIRPIYVIPSDGVDRQLDVDRQPDVSGALESALWKSQDWLAGRMDGLSLRIDTFQGEPDIGFLRLTKTAAEMEAGGIDTIHYVEQQFNAAGYANDSNKILLALYDGGQGSHPNQAGVLCGAGMWPPKIPGRTAIANLSPACGFNPQSNEFAFIDTVIPHEIFHTMGAVPESAPNHDGTAHSTDPTDIMYGKSQQTLAQVEALAVDPGRDDYWNIVPRWLANNHPNLLIDITGQGSVSSEARPNKYLSDPACEDDCTMVFRKNEQTTLQAFPERFWRLNKWTGAGIVKNKAYALTMDSDKSVAAVFEPIAELDIGVRKPGLGTVQAIGQGVCKATCKYEVPAGRRANLVAKPAKDARFVRWIGGCGVKPQCTFPAKQGAHKRTAVFAKNR